MVKDAEMPERVMYDNEFHLHQEDDVSPINWKTL